MAGWLAGAAGGVSGVLLSASPVRIAVASFLQHPVAIAAAQHNVGDGRRALFGDKKLHFSSTRRPESGEQALLRDRVLNQIRVAVQMKPERLGAHAADRRDRRKIALVAGAHEHGRRASPRRFGNMQHRFRSRDRLEPKRAIVVAADFRKQKGRSRPILRCASNEPLDQIARVPMAPMIGLRENGADAENRDRTAIQYSR